MKFFQSASTRRTWVIAQDPSFTDKRKRPIFTQVEIPNEYIEPGPKGSRIHVIDYDATLNKMLEPIAISDERWSGLLPVTDQVSRSDIDGLLSDPGFHAHNVYALIANTLLTFEQALGRTVSWGFDSGAHQLKVAPHAFADLNAFYSRDDECLTFGYFPRGGRKPDFFFTCLSADIVIHETTHAILDGLRTEYVRPSSIDQAAFHEAFADIVALLSGFQHEAVVNVALGRPFEGKTISTSLLELEALRENALVQLGKEFGTVLADTYPADFRGGALRRSAEMRPGHNYYNDPEWRQEAHKFGEVLVAPIMHAFLSIWHERTLALDPVSSGRVDRERAVEEGMAAASHLLKMCIRAIDYLPPTNVQFTDFFSALLTADRETVPDDKKYGYRSILFEAGVAYGIIREEKTLETSFWGPPFDPETIIYGFSSHDQMTWDKESLSRFIWENLRTLRLEPQAFTKVLSVRPVERLGPMGCRTRETVVEYLQILNILASQLDSLGIERPEEMGTNEYIQLHGGGTLIFNDYGQLKFHIGTGVTSPRQSDRLKSLWNMGHFSKQQADVSQFAAMHRARAMDARHRKTTEQW